MKTVKGLLIMIRQTLKSPSVWAFSIAAALLFAYGCGTLENKGSAGENSLPEVFIVNVPPDGSEFSISPTVYWYGTDSDGRITRYDYTVVTGAEVDSVTANLPGSQSPIEKYIAFVLNDQFPRWISIFVDSAEAGQLPTQEQIRLYAAPFAATCDTVWTYERDSEGNRIDSTAILVDCESDTISQYFFIRAVDDQDSSSAIKYRSYKRRNHWPETAVNSGFNQYAEYMSLPNLTVTYNGIQLTWGGSDRLDFVPPSVPFLEYHWRLYGPYPYDPNLPDQRPTLSDTLGRQPVYESENPDPLVGVWVRDTTTIVYDLWRQADASPDPLNDTTITRSAWFMLVVTARDDAFISDETPAVATFKALNPKFERKLAYVDEGWYSLDTWTNPSARPRVSEPFTNQGFYWNLVKMVYPEADTMLDFWWRSKAPPPTRLCPDPRRPRCGNFVSLEMLAKHRLCLVTDDDIFEQISPPGAAPAVRETYRKYLDAGGMIWLFGRHSLLPETETTNGSKERLFDLCTYGTNIYDNLGCNYFDIEGMYYPAWRANAIPINRQGEPARAPRSNDEFIAANLVATGTGLPQRLEIDRARVDSMFILQFIINAINTPTPQPIIGVPDVNFLVLGSNSTPLYMYESWRPGGPIPPSDGPSFSNGKPVGVRRIGPSRETPLYKVCYMTFPLYFIKQEQSEELFRKMVDWFFLPFSQS